MSSTTMMHLLPSSDDPYPLQVKSEVQSSGTAVLTLDVLGGNTLHIFTDNPAHLRQIANAALDLAAEQAANQLEVAQVTE